jgi:hypothetical protein
MAEDKWPEFLYGGLSIEDYVQLVLSDENREIKNEIFGLLNMIRDIAKYPYPTPEETFRYISAYCRAICALLAVD